MALAPNTLDGLVRLGVTEALFESRTVLIAKVTAWYPDKQAIDAKPLIKRKRIVDEETVVDEYSVLKQIPVQFPRWGGFVIRFPLQVDDVVILIIADREIERWLAGTDPKTVIEPRGFRVGSLDDAIAIPGISPWASPIADLDDGELVVGREDGAGELRVAADGGVTVASNVEVRLAAGGEADQHIPRGEDLLQAIQTLVNQIQTHVHPASLAVSGATAEGTTLVTATVFQAPQSSTLSQKAKVK